MQYAVNEHIAFLFWNTFAKMLKTFFAKMFVYSI